MDAIQLLHKYYVKVLKIDGTIVADPLENSGVTFTKSIYVVGQRANLGSFTIKLKDVRDPSNKYLITTYNSLDFEQRVEIYANELGTGQPVFTGVITQPPSDLDNPTIAGTSILRRLETRRLRRYETINEFPHIFLQRLLKVYRQIVVDNFADLSKWTIVSGDWAASGNELTASTSAAQINLTGTLTREQYDNLKISFDVNIPTSRSFGLNILNDPGLTLYQSVAAYEDPAVDPPNNANFIAYTWNAGVATVAQSVYFGYAAATYFHWDLYTWMEAGGRRIILEINKTAVLNYLDTRSGTEHGGLVILALGSESSTGTTKISNFVISTFQNAILPGAIPISSTKVSQTFTGDPNLSAIEWLALNQGWQFNLLPQAGEGNDILEASATLGRDLSNKIILEENKDIILLQHSKTSENLATSLSLYGGSQDDYTANFVANAVNQFATYGIVEAEYQDERVVDSGTAKLLSFNKLNVFSLGKTSISGKIIDPTKLSLTTPVAGVNRALWGQPDWGQSVGLRPGDYIWLRIPTRNIDRNAQIISITESDSDPSIDVIFDYYPWEKPDQLLKFNEDYKMLFRAFINRMNAQTIRLTTAGGGATINWYVFLRGFMPSVIFDALMTPGGGTGATNILIDGIDRTAALGGSWAGDIHFKDTTWLTLPGNHTVGIQCATVKTFDVFLQTQIIS